MPDLTCRPHLHLALLSVIALAACAPSQAPPVTASPARSAPAPTAAAPVATDTTPFDARFIDAMIPHHEGAVTMAQEALTKAEHPELRELAQQIIVAQEREIADMKAWRQAWYPSLPMTEGMPMMSGMEHGKGMDHGAGMDMGKGSGMGMGGAMGSQGHGTAAPATTGHAMTYDATFIHGMIPHHESALMMAEHALKEGEHPEVRQLAQAILDSQRKEIDQMKAWRMAWFGH